MGIQFRALARVALTMSLLELLRTEFKILGDGNLFWSAKLLWPVLRTGFTAEVELRHSKDFTQLQCAYTNAELTLLRQRGTMKHRKYGQRSLARAACTHGEAGNQLENGRISTP